MRNKLLTLSALLAVGLIMASALISLGRKDKNSPPPNCDLLERGERREVYVCGALTQPQRQVVLDWISSVAGQAVTKKQISAGEEFRGERASVMFQDRGQLRNLFMEGRLGPPTNEMLLTVEWR